MIEFIQTLTQLKEVLWTLVALVGIAFTVISLLKAHLNESYSKFNLIDIFATNGIFSGSKARLNLAFAFSSWVLILVAMKVTTVTSDFVMLFASYMGAWVVDRMDSRRKNTLPNLGGDGNVSSKSKDN